MGVMVPGWDPRKRNEITASTVTLAQFAEPLARARAPLYFAVYGELDEAALDLALRLRARGVALQTTTRHHSAAPRGAQTLLIGSGTPPAADGWTEMDLGSDGGSTARHKPGRTTFANIVLERGILEAAPADWLTVTCGDGDRAVRYRALFLVDRTPSTARPGSLSGGGGPVPILTGMLVPAVQRCR